jgi:anti-sigma regulatory factor (Ser/Thr protein kinase)
MTEIMAAKEEAEKARKDAETANKSKDDFLARMSHEIRSPMNAIIGMSELMRTDNLDEIQQGYFRDIRTMARSLLGIINDILDFSKIEAGKMELNPVTFNIWSLLNNIGSVNRFLANSKDLEFIEERSPDVPEVIVADDIRVRQIFSNLVSNAIKYTKTGFVKIALSVDGGALVFTVRDSGIGIKPDDLNRIFDPFVRTDANKNRSIGGTGLGLPIVKQLVDLMGGSLEVESEYGKGSLFRVTLPLEKGDPSKLTVGIDGVPFVKANAARMPSILVVDDLPVNLSVAQGFLATHDMQVDTAESGPEAIEKVREKSLRFDIYGPHDARYGRHRGHKTPARNECIHTDCRPHCQCGSRGAGDVPLERFRRLYLKADYCRGTESGSV